MLQIWKSYFSAPMGILYQGMVMCHFGSTVPAVSDMHSGRRAVTIGSIPADRRRAMLTCRAVASAHTVAAQAVALLQQIIITLCSCAQRCDVTTRRPRAQCGDVTRRLGNRRAHRGVSIPTQRVSGQPMLYLVHAHPNYPYLMW
jgi:hypothetical protein